MPDRADLVVPPGPGLPRGLVVPGGELRERFARSTGPGGQSVNTTDSRVELRLNLRTTSALSEQQRERVLRVLGGEIVVRAAEHRSQHRNRAAARDRLAMRLREALAPPPPARVPTKPSKSSRRRRLDAKRLRGRTKALRARVHEDP